MSKLNITGIPKDILLYNLWKHASDSRYMKYFNKKYNLNIDKIRRDIRHMIKNKRNIYLTTYYGKSLYLDITNDYLDTEMYNKYNETPAEEIILLIKFNELKKFVLTYYTR